LRETQEVTGFTTDYVNQIAINLRDRYRSGFPILKELVQNADDAGAKSWRSGSTLAWRGSRPHAAQGAGSLGVERWEVRGNRSPRNSLVWTERQGG
jgi:hypothetical protein